jgi:O-acetyl-ADP-ribose deacetylase (regulator of RNase III)
MVIIHEGDIFTSRADVLVNPVNCVGVMGAGLAKQFKEKYSWCENLYWLDMKQKKYRTGNVILYRDPFFRSPSILFFPTKNHWKNPSRLEYVEEGLNDFVAKYESWNIKRIAFPVLGAGLGGLERNTVVDLMKEKLNDLPIEVEIWEKHHGGFSVRGGKRLV